MDRLFYSKIFQTEREQTPQMRSLFAFVCLISNAL